jgi:hypothetical protein
MMIMLFVEEDEGAALEAREFPVDSGVPGNGMDDVLLVLVSLSEDDDEDGIPAWVVVGFPFGRPPFPVPLPFPPLLPVLEFPLLPLLPFPLPLPLLPDDEPSDEDPQEEPIQTEGIGIGMGVLIPELELGLPP